MNDWLAPAAIIAVLGALGTWGGVIFSRRNNKDTLLLASRDNYLDRMSADLKETNDRLDKTIARVEALSATVAEQEEKIRVLEDREWHLRRYITTLVDFIRGHNLTPPGPPTNLRL